MAPKVNIGQAPKITDGSWVVQVRNLANEVWRVFSIITGWASKNFCTENDVINIVERTLKTKVILLKQVEEPAFVPDGYVAIYADLNDGNQPKLKYSTSAGEGVVVRVVFQENEASEEI
jgi:hypothetical protein